MSTEELYVEGPGREFDTKLDLWLRDLLPLTPGCPAAVRKRALILACREFFEQSAAWRVTIGPKNMQANRKRYSLSPYDASSDVVHVLGVDFNGRPLRPYSVKPTREMQEADIPTGYWLEGPDTVRLWPMPMTNLDAALHFHVAITPKQTVKLLPRVAKTHFYDAIFDGAAGRLMGQPAKPYSNPPLAQYHMQRFRAAIGKYAGKAKQGFSPGAAAWSFPRFGK